MKDADAAVEILVAVAHRWSPWSDPSERLLRHPTGDRTSLSVIADRTLGWSLDLRRRGSSCKYWEKIAHALRDVAGTGKIHYGDLPDDLLLAVMSQPRGRFIPGVEHTEAAKALEECLHAGRHDRVGGSDGKLATETHRITRPGRRSDD